ncbi:RBBP9/YdeN family alpha/beta hydrolase [Pseudomonas typographi]|uniref:Serine hydrolase family protein n=1 Tax=Pseudomonas typographi TaxID=2715964 RepID=A0ABR7Z3L2_9PSED|nr:alpha/beta hydrolase [Pseudomonas typographi]MBD1551928.1 serine hydrolase family protein [Pseudomonas typographi]MBD1599993.1 serine hydrolase family protein [Pseudomonas typographi]
MSDVRVLILPGRGNSGEQHWQSIWESNHPAYQRVLQKEWDNPDLDDWVQALDAAINHDQTPVVLVAHSLSVSLVSHWAKHHSGPVKAALLVAPSDVEAEDYPPGTVGFAPIPLQPLPFRTVVVASTDDPKVTLARAEQFAEAWGATLEIAGAHGHLGSAAELGAWDFGARLLRGLIGEKVDKAVLE